ncbi:hypothetical protein [Tautonia marina]|uniref:hypothetical protein n=1 Tax=Tautonia marina TaxID=2653855 RepID=UPI0012606674|nr:hypothetical protein [Tautonia marina]
MRTRRSWLMTAAMVGVALLVAVVPALAAELFGTVKTVNPDEKTLVVVEKKSGDEVTVTITEKTVFINPKGKQAKKFDLENFKKREGKARVRIEHEDGVASKITLTPKKKRGGPEE